MRRALAVSAIVCSLAAEAGAEPQRVVFVSTPAPIVDASRTALLGWGIEVVPIDGESPGDHMPAAERAASDLAAREHAAAVVWLSGSGGEAALWMYDAVEQQLVTRRVAHPGTIDPATAAGLALSVKTLLRHSQVAPPAERVLLPRAARPVDQRWSIAPRFGVDWRKVEGDDITLRFGLDAGVRVWRSLSARAHLASGPDLAVEDPDFDGHLSDSQLGIGAAWRAPLGRFSLSAAALADFHVTRLRGRVVVADRATSVWRLNPAGRLEVAADVQLGERFRIGAYVGASALARRQRYLVRGEPVLELPVLGISTGISFVITAD